MLYNKYRVTGTIPFYFLGLILIKYLSTVNCAGLRKAFIRKESYIKCGLYILEYIHPSVYQNFKGIPIIILSFYQ